jgi:hypothetical protein
MGSEPLNELERELLELCSMSGETTTTLHEEMLEAPLDRGIVEATLRGLVERGLMTTSRGTYSGTQFARDGSHGFERTYEDDWWDVTASGRAAIGES